MSKLPENKGFKYGFKIGIILFLLAQLISFLNYIFSVFRINTPPGVSVHGFWDIGFPFSMYYGMYDVFHGDLNFTGLIGNILIAIIFSVAVGLIFKFVQSKNSPRRVKLK